MHVELLVKFAEFLADKATDTDREVVADFIEKCLVVEIKKLEIPEDASTLAEKEEVELQEEIKPEEVPTRSGNGHKIEKKRNLFDEEKDTIRRWFLDVNGQIENDACVAFRTTNMDPEVAIFQVVGFVSYLHLCIAAGKLLIRDMTSYLEFLKGHRALWATYNSPRYQRLRAKLGIAEPATKVATAAVALEESLDRGGF